MNRIAGVITVAFLVAGCGGESFEPATRGVERDVTVELAATEARVTVKDPSAWETPELTIRCRERSGEVVMEGAPNVIDKEGRASWPVREEEGEAPIRASRAYVCAVRQAFSPNRYSVQMEQVG